MKISNRDISDYLFLLIAFYVIDDAVRVYRLLSFGYGLVPEWGGEWGIVMRILGPAALIFIGVWRFRVKPKKLAFCLFGVSRLLSLNSMFIEKKLNLGFPAMGVALLTDMVALYLSVITFKQSDATKRDLPPRRLLLQLVLVAGTILLVIVSYFILTTLHK